MSEVDLPQDNGVSETRPSEESGCLSESPEKNADTPPVKRRRGRKSGSPRQSVERPKREIKPVPAVYQNKSLGHDRRAFRKVRDWESTKTPWTPEELLRLKETLQKHGSTRVLNDETLVPGRKSDWIRTTMAQISAPSRHKPSSVKSYTRKCNMLERVVVKDNTEVKAPVTQWYEKILGIGEGATNAKTLSKALHLIADFENHPNPEECGGVDYAAIYRYFAELSVGALPVDVNEASANVVVELLRDLAQQVAASANAGETLPSINKVDIWPVENVRNPTTRDPTPVEKEEAKAVADGPPEEIVGGLIDHVGLNPFGFPLDSIIQYDEEQ